MNASRAQPAEPADALSRRAAADPDALKLLPADYLW
jgi:hypothetical protein